MRGGCRPEAFIRPYLYYAGQISISALIKAVVWQRLQRPSVGAIAVSWGWMEAVILSIFCAAGSMVKNLGPVPCAVVIFLNIKYCVCWISKDSAAAHWKIFY